MCTKNTSPETPQKIAVNNVIIWDGIPFVYGILLFVESQHAARFCRTPEGKIHPNPNIGTGLVPIVISETEDIKIASLEPGDFYYKDGEIKQKQAGDGANFYGGKKILALPEHFSAHHVFSICYGSLKEKQGILIECEEKDKIDYIKLTSDFNFIIKRENNWDDVFDLFLAQHCGEISTAEFNGTNVLTFKKYLKERFPTPLPDMRNIINAFELTLSFFSLKNSDQKWRVKEDILKKDIEEALEEAKNINYKSLV